MGPERCRANCARAARAGEGGDWSLERFARFLYRASTAIRASSCRGAHRPKSTKTVPIVWSNASIGLQDHFPPARDSVEVIGPEPSLRPQPDTKVANRTICVHLSVAPFGAETFVSAIPAEIEEPKKNRPAFGGAFGRLLVCGGASYRFYSMTRYPVGPSCLPEPMLSSNP